MVFYCNIYGSVYEMQKENTPRKLLHNQEKIDTELVPKLRTKKAKIGSFSVYMLKVHLPDSLVDKFVTRKRLEQGL